MKRNWKTVVIPALLVILLCAMMMYKPEIWGYLIQRMLAAPVYIVR